MISLGFQQVLTMFPATVLVAILTKFDVGVTLLTSGLGTIIALLVTRRRIPLYYGSSFSYIAVVISAMNLYAPQCFNDPATVYCPDGVRLVQVGILGTGRGRDPDRPAHHARRQGGARQGAAAHHHRQHRHRHRHLAGRGGAEPGVGLAPDQAGASWLIAFITLIATVAFSVYLQNRGLLGMLPILLGAIVGYIVSLLFGLVDFSRVAEAQWLRVPSITLPAFNDPNALSLVFSIALIAIATIPESTAHLYQMSLYIDALAKQLNRVPASIKNLIGLNLVADGSQDIVAGMFGGAPGTNYGENNSLMAITRNYSAAVLMAAGAIAIALAFVGKLAALVNTIPVAVIGGLAIYLFGVIGMQGVALIQSEKVNLFEPQQLAVGAIILVLGIGGALFMPNGMYRSRSRSCSPMAFRRSCSPPSSAS